MATLQQLEESIRTLPREEFFRLAEWMWQEQEKVLGPAEFESAELESEILKGASGPRISVDQTLMDELRTSWRTKR